MKSKNKKKKIDVTFLILNYNGKKLTKILLDSIKKQNFKGTYEVIVVDNNSSGDDVSFFKKNYPSVKLIKNKENLGTPGVNTAIPFISGRYVFFLNNDIELMKDTLSKMYNYIEKNNNVGVIAPRSINYYKKDIKSGGLWLSRSLYAGHYLNDKVKEPFEVPYAGIFMFRKKILDKRKYIFDNDYFIYSEDVDFCLCSWVMGYKVVFLPASEFYHMHAATIKKQTYNLTYLIEKNLLSTFIKNFPLRLLILYSPYVITMRLVGILKDLLKLELRNLLARISAMSYILLNLFKILHKRKNIQKYRKIKSKDMKNLFTEKYLLKPVVPV